MTQAVYRIAFRQEGSQVNCYLAKPDTMEGAFIISSMSLRMLKVPGVWDEWRAVIQKGMTQITQDVTGSAPKAWIEEKAPESERGGHA